MDQFWKWTNSLMILSIVISCKIHVDEKYKIFYCTVNKPKLPCNMVQWSLKKPLVTVHRNGNIDRVTALVVTGHVEAYVQRLQWWPGQWSWWPFCFSVQQWKLFLIFFRDFNYMSIMTSEIPSTVTVFSAACWGEQQRKHQSSILLDLCEGNPPVAGGFPS